MDNPPFYNKDKINLENKDDFECIVIKPGNIESVSWLDPEYLSKLMKLNLCYSITVNANNFVEMIATHLEINKLKDEISIKTEIICETPNYVYEMVYVDANMIYAEDTVKVMNQFAKLLNLNDDDIYSNAIVFKNHLNSNNMMKFESVSCKDLEKILYDRVNTNIVLYDDNWSDKTVFGDLTIFADEFFEGEYINKIELPFLMHNINIWYTTELGKMNICGKLINKPIYKCLWFTMRSEEYRGNLLLSEVEKIIELSNKLTDYKTPGIFLEDKYDDYGRQIIYNKYKVLDIMYKSH